MNRFRLIVALVCLATGTLAALGYGMEPTTDLRKETNEQASEENRQKEAEEVKRLREFYLRNQSVFVRRNEFILELNTLYSRNTRQVLVPGTGGVTNANETLQFLENTLIARYGLLDGLELDLFAPYVHGERETDFGTSRTTDKDNGVGDIGGAVRYEVWYEQGNRPALVVDVSGKSRTGGEGLTGTGNWNAGGGVTLVKSVDPVVFFGRLGYTYNFASQTRNLGNIVDYRIGMGFSLNDRVAFNVQFAGASIGSSSFTGTDSTGPLTVSTQHITVMNVIFTSTIQVNKDFFIEPLVGVGMTDQSFTLVGVRLPYRF